jgi:hypothetical protein
MKLFRQNHSDAPDARILAVPALAFFGGALLGRVFGLRGLARGAMTALAFGGIGRKLLVAPPPRLTHARPNLRRPPRRTALRRAEKRRPARRRT